MRRNIVLIGLMGSGKTTVGRLLAQRLGWEFVDTDDLVVAAAGQSIPEIFANRGEQEFRRLERQAVQQALAGSGRVVATGGGVPVDPANRQVLRERGWVVWLQAPASVLYQRVAQGDGVLSRPLLAGADPVARLAELQAARAEAYREAAHWVLSTESLSAAQAAEAILETFMRWADKGGEEATT